MTSTQHCSGYQDAHHRTDELRDDVEQCIRVATLPSRQNVSVTDGLKWAPDCLPHGEYTMAIAVSPMAIPVRTRRSVGSE